MVLGETSNSSLAQNNEGQNLARPSSQLGHDAVTPPPNTYQTSSPQPSYPSTVQDQPPPPQQQQQQQLGYQQQQQPPPQQLQPQPEAGYNNVNIQRNPSLAHYNGPPPSQQQIQQVLQPQQIPAVQQQQARVTNMQPQEQYQQQPQQPQYGYRDPVATGRWPSSVPPPQAVEKSEPVILFYGKLSIFFIFLLYSDNSPVKALYDYSAATEEEFDFKAGDIIAVTTTPYDGWWSGELLDENRRQKGRNIFPSNFVRLF